MNRYPHTESPILTKSHGDQPFTVDPKKSFTMPARFYNAPDIYEREKEAIFYNSWFYVGHLSQLTEPGHYLTASIHEQNIFVVRGRDNILRGFYNVCAHRGHELLSGQGKTSLIVCPYHAWSYALDGTLKKARNSDNVAGFNPCEFSLKSVRVEVLCGLVFINLDTDAVPLKDQIPGLEREIRAYCPEVDNLQFARRDEYKVKCNWKVLVDNFLECYHCAPAHEAFVDLVDMNTYRTVTHGIYSSQIAGAPRATSNRAFNFEKGSVDFGYAGWFLWPNLTIWLYPGEANLSILQINPNGIADTVEYQDWFLPTPTPSKQQQAAMDYQKDILQPEDIGLCESVQRGLQSRAYNQGRFIVDNELSELSEHAVHHFQSMVVKALGAELG